MSQDQRARSGTFEVSLRDTKHTAAIGSTCASQERCTVMKFDSATSCACGLLLQGFPGGASTLCGTGTPRSLRRVRVIAFPEPAMGGPRGLPAALTFHIQLLGGKGKGKLENRGREPQVLGAGKRRSCRRGTLPRAATIRRRGRRRYRSPGRGDYSDRFSGRSRGNRITSRIERELVKSMASRSMPMPSPPAGGIP